MGDAQMEQHEPAATEDTLDVSLLAAWRRGDTTAGETLVVRHYAGVYRFFATKATEAVEDLTQRTFLTCLEAHSTPRGGESFRAYLFGVARFVFIRHRRTSFRETRKRRYYENNPAAPAVGSPGTFAGLREEEKLLLTALRKLPLEHQMTLELFYWEELSVPEIARVLDVAEGTIKSRLFRARASLKAHIDALDAPEALKASTISSLESWARIVQHPSRRSPL